jgi:hypothetical protein
MLSNIRNNKIEVRQEPFRHIIVDNFFDDATLTGIEASFEALKALGLSETHVLDRLARFPSYDAYCYVFPRDVPAPLNVFLSPEWKEFLSGVFGLECSNDVVAEYHHHKAGSKTGITHTDFIECFFANKPAPNGMNPWHYECDYTGGNDPNAKLLTRVRAIAFLYYFGGPDWRPGDGGETTIGFHEKADPIRNRLFAFEISPRSFHNFVSNKRIDRNTVIGWLHFTKEDAVANFGSVVEQWARSEVNGEKGDSLNVS